MSKGITTWKTKTGDFSKEKPQAGNCCHLVKKVAGTPATNERYLRAPRGNIYGSALTPANIDFSRLKFLTPVPNLYFTSASAEFPGIGATVVAGSRLYTHLTGDPVNPGRDMYGLV